MITLLIFIITLSGKKNLLNGPQGGSALLRACRQPVQDEKRCVK
jgi:hypothetical protein